MSRNARRHRMRRTAIAVLAIFALLFQGAFVIACDVHDLSHMDVSGTSDRAFPAEHEYGRAASSFQADHDTAAVEEGWHAVFATGHGCLQVFGTVAPISVDPLRLPAIGLPSPAHDGGPPAPSTLLLRPPIVL